MGFISRPVIHAKEITTTATDKPNTPDFEVKNERNKDIKILYITLVPDPTFRATGIIIIEHFGNPPIINLPAGTLVRSNELVLKFDEGAIFERNSSLKIFTWLSGAGTGKVTAYITTGE